MRGKQRYGNYYCAQCWKSLVCLCDAVNLHVSERITHRSESHSATHAHAPISKPILLNGTSVMCNYYLRFENWKLNGKSIWQQEMPPPLLLPVSISSGTNFEVIHLKCERQFLFKWRRRISIRCALTLGCNANSEYGIHCNVYKWVETENLSSYLVGKCH